MYEIDTYRGLATSNQKPPLHDLIDCPCLWKLKPPLLSEGLGGHNCAVDTDLEEKMSLLFLPISLQPSSQNAEYLTDSTHSINVAFVVLVS